MTEPGLDRLRVGAGWIASAAAVCRRSWNLKRPSFARQTAGAYTLRVKPRRQTGPPRSFVKISHRRREGMQPCERRGLLVHPFAIGSLPLFA